LYFSPSTSLPSALPGYSGTKALIFTYRMQDTQIQMPGYQVLRAWILRYRSCRILRYMGLDAQKQGLVYSGTGAWIVRYRVLDTQVQGPG
jgi:hypothetical protein